MHPMFLHYELENSIVHDEGWKERVNEWRGNTLLLVQELSCLFLGVEMTMKIDKTILHYI